MSRCARTVTSLSHMCCTVTRHHYVIVALSIIGKFVSPARCSYTEWSVTKKCEFEIETAQTVVYFHTGRCHAISVNLLKETTATIMQMCANLNKLITTTQYRDAAANVDDYFLDFITTLKLSAAVASFASIYTVHSADYAVSRCPSVCPSVTRRYSM